MIKAGASWEGIHLKMHEMVVRGLLKIGILIAGPSKATGEELVTEVRGFMVDSASLAADSC